MNIDITSLATGFGIAVVLCLVAYFMRKKKGLELEKLKLIAKQADEDIRKAHEGVRKLWDIFNEVGK